MSGAAPQLLSRCLLPGTPTCHKSFSSLGRKMLVAYALLQRLQMGTAIAHDKLGTAQSTQRSGSDHGDSGSNAHKELG